MLRSLFRSRRFIIGILLIAIAFFLIFLKSNLPNRSVPGTASSYSPRYSVQPASYTPGYAVIRESRPGYSTSHTNGSRNSLKQRINRKIDRVIGLIDDIVD